MKRLMALTMLAACGATPEMTIDPQLQRYADEFETQGIKYGAFKQLPPIRIEIANLDGTNRSGQCRGQGTPYPIITIDEGTFKNGFNIEAIMMHEFGHCILNLDHRTDKIKRTGKPDLEPIMSTDLFWIGNDYIFERDVLLKDLLDSFKKAGAL